MATVAPVITKIGEHAVKFVWGPLTSANADGAPTGKRFADYVDRSVQVEGTFGTGTFAMQGSNDGSNYQPLTDPQGNAISKTTPSVEQITEATQLQRPVVTGADGATSLTVTVIARRQRGGVEV